MISALKAWKTSIWNVSRCSIKWIYLVQHDPTLVSKYMLWGWDWYYTEFTQKVFYARIFRLCYYYHQLCIVIVTIVKCCETYMQYDWSKRAYFSYSTTIIQIKKDHLQYKMKWCRLKKGCNLSTLVNRW